MPVLSCSSTLPCRPFESSFIPEGSGDTDAQDAPQVLDVVYFDRDILGRRMGSCAIGRAAAGAGAGDLSGQPEGAPSTGRSRPDRIVVPTPCAAADSGFGGGGNATGWDGC